jgi:hypothetical protein
MVLLAIYGAVAFGSNGTEVMLCIGAVLVCAGTEGLAWVARGFIEPKA